MIIFRGNAQLPKYTSWDEMIRRTHSISTINDLKKVYPDPRDIELFPGGNVLLHYGNPNLSV